MFSQEEGGNGPAAICLLLINQNSQMLSKNARTILSLLEGMSGSDAVSVQLEKEHQV